ncbi:glycoside hydrolase family 3 N-terminal domain-containing protein [Candidatus Palauibacter sp.]|uniref:glycoside hydrolase family 3 N-terminal domain-containing protein n=1 Tax=Candidatus Palauibacter sp. TaxID=3101350 RepID=UPI003B021561
MSGSRKRSGRGRPVPRGRSVATLGLATLLAASTFACVSSANPAASGSAASPPVSGPAASPPASGPAGAGAAADPGAGATADPSAAADSGALGSDAVASDAGAFLGGRPVEPALSAEARAWVEETLAGLSLRERVAQLVMVWMSGGYAPRDDEEFTRVESLVRDDAIGGIVISLGTPLGYAARLNRLQASADVPLLVGADFESGAGFRVSGVFALPNMLEMPGATVLPPAMALGAADDEDFAYSAGRVTGVEARALGVHITFSPVLDVNNNPANPIINTRSFGEDPERVAALGAAFIRGAHDAGLLATAKHFPGHGDTGTDSHVALPIIPGDRARLDSLELVPFRRAIAEGVDAVMTAHVAAPGILGAGAPPATLSPYFMTDMLRDDLGFDGVLFTDALDMAAIADGYGASEAAIRSLEAGSDVLLMPREPLRAIAAVVGAVRSGRLTAERIEASARRVLELKARARLHEGAEVDPDAIPRLVGTQWHESFARGVATRSITLVRNEADAVPLDRVESRSVRSVLSVTFAGTNDLAAGRVFNRELGRTVRVRRARIGFDTHPGVYDSLLRRARSVDAVIFSAYVRPGAARDSTDLPEEVRSFFYRLDDAGRTSVLVSFGSPYLLTSVPEAKAYLIAWGGADASQEAAALALLGAPISGRLPISLPPRHALGDGLISGGNPEAEPVPAPAHIGEPGPPVADGRMRRAWEEWPVNVGMDGDSLARVDRIIDAAIRDGATPGAVLAAGRGDRVVRLRGYGNLNWTAGAPSMAGAPSAPGTAAADSSLYDLASLTKVVATTTGVMQLIDRGELSLDTRIGEHLPEWSQGWKRDVTVRHLLTHQGGLPPFRPFWRTLRGEEEYREAIAALEPDYEPGDDGERTVYSDIGFMTLGFLIEEITGQALDYYLHESVFRPLGMTETWFDPPRSLYRRTAPTEVDTVYRHRHVHGEVHDENAHALGGVAGHAGLFSSARDLAKFAAWILAAAREGRDLAVTARPPPGAYTRSFAARLDSPSPEIVAQFTARAAPASSRALGWDTPSGRSSAGDYFGEGAFGHTGFTGTSMWMDPELDLFVVLLTNRVNPTRDNRKHIELRRAVHDAVATSIRDRTVRPRDRTVRPRDRTEGPRDRTEGPRDRTEGPRDAGGPAPPARDR